jgi:threonine/homoserine/homoserine lactone efflux protein
VAVGLSIHTAGTVLGVSALFSSLPAVYHALRWAGAAYLLYLALKAFLDRSGPVATAAGLPDDPAARLHARKAFRSALIVNLLNPKVILFNVAFLPQFVRPELGHVWLQFLVLGLTFVLVDLTVDGTVGLVAGQLHRRQRAGRGFGRTLNILSGSIFTALAVRLLVPGE